MIRKLVPAALSSCPDIKNNITSAQGLMRLNYSVTGTLFGDILLSAFEFELEQSQRGQNGELNGLNVRKISPLLTLYKAIVLGGGVGKIILR